MSKFDILKSIIFQLNPMKAEYKECLQYILNEMDKY